MRRLRTLAIMLGGASAAVMVLRHARGSAGLETPGGIVMGDAAGYDSLSRVLLGSFCSGTESTGSSLGRSEVAGQVHGRPR
jgi:hypothetical protein